MSRKRKMSAAEKQRRRERRAARRTARVSALTDGEQERRDRIQAEVADAGTRALTRLLGRSEKVHKERLKERAA